MKLKNVFFFLKKLKKKKKKLGSDTFSIVSCTIRDPSPRDFSLMTLLANIDPYVVQYAHSLSMEDTGAQGPIN